MKNLEPLLPHHQPSFSCLHPFVIVVTVIHVLDLMVDGYTEGLLGVTEGLL